MLILVVLCTNHGVITSPSLTGQLCLQHIIRFDGDPVKILTKQIVLDRAPVSWNHLSQQLPISYLRHSKSQAWHLLFSISKKIWAAEIKQGPHFLQKGKEVLELTNGTYKELRTTPQGSTMLQIPEIVLNLTALDRGYPVYITGLECMHSSEKIPKKWCLHTCRILTWEILCMCWEERWSHTWRWFWSGVPLSTRRCAAGTSRKLFARCVFGFLTRCPCHTKHHSKQLSDTSFTGGMTDGRVDVRK